MRVADGTTAEARKQFSDPHVLIGSAIDLETGDIDYSLKRLLYNYAEYDCVDAWVDDCMDTTGASAGSCGLSAAISYSARAAR